MRVKANEDKIDQIEGREKLADNRIGILEKKVEEAGKLASEVQKDTKDCF